jgi:hypothetical protein
VAGYGAVVLGRWSLHAIRWTRDLFSTVASKP